MSLGLDHSVRDARGERPSKDPPAPVGGKGRRTSTVVCGLSLRSAALESLPGPRSQSLFQRHPWPGLACPQSEAQKWTQKAGGSCESPPWSHLSHDGPAALDHRGLLLRLSEECHQQHLGAWRPEIPPHLPQAQDRAPTPGEARVSVPHLPSSPAPALAHSQPSKHPWSCSPSILVLRDFKTQNLCRDALPLTSAGRLPAQQLRSSQPVSPPEHGFPPAPA